MRIVQRRAPPTLCNPSNMKISSLPTLAGSAALLSLLCACHGSSGSSGSALPTITNLGLAVDQVKGSGDLWLLSVSEALQGGSDLNADGDAEDHVVSVLDVASGVVTPTSLDVTRHPYAPLWGVNGSLAVIGVSETGQGEQDLNGDGDSLDFGLHLFEAATGGVRSLGISVFDVAFVGADAVGFFVSEAEEGRTDLNEDGDVHDTVLHLYDPHADEVVIAELQAYPLFDGRFAAFTLAESPGVDLNDDGDVLDANVLQVVDTRTRAIENLRLAVDTVALGFGAGRLVVPVLESANGETDLNFDGDARDIALWTYDPLTDVLRDTGLSGPPPGAYHPPGPSSNGRLVLYTGETDGLDRNGDGDVEDVLPVVLEPATGALFDPGLAIDVFASSVALAGELLGIEVDETRHGLDLNRDHDLADQVVHVADLALGTVRNLGLVASEITSAAERLLVPRFEDWDEADWNGDGDRDDLVAFLCEQDTRTTNTRLSTSGFALDLPDERALLLGREPLAGGGFELEWIVYDARARVPHFLNLFGGFASHATRAGDKALFTVNEAFQGADLNGDGDRGDDVMHVVE